jgi:prepilin-type N-terminal cleavage/methylation domain-containing protein
MGNANYRTSVAGRDGFSLVEVIIAILILAVGVLGLAGTTAHITRQITLADLMTERSVAFQTTIDRLQSLPFADVSTGQDSVGVYFVSWSSALDGPQSKNVTIVTLGPGLASGAPPGLNPQVADTFEFRVLRR